jgi:hypothetical protein
VKIVVLHGGDGKTDAVKALKILEEHTPDVQIILLDSDWLMFPVRLAECLKEAVRVVLIFSPSVTQSSWLPFLLGFSVGRHERILAYGVDLKDLPETLFSQIEPFIREKDFRAYFSKNAPLWAAEEHEQEARTALLDQGIPVTYRAFANCIRDRNLQGVNLFLQAGFLPNSYEAGIPYLCLAARTGDRDIVGTLLKAGVDVNARSQDRGGSALIDSALGKYDDIGADLLAAGAEVNAKSKDGQSALIIAVGLNDAVFAEMLLRSGANPDDPDALGASARKYASLFNKPAIMELFEKYAAR